MSSGAGSGPIEDLAAVLSQRAAPHPSPTQVIILAGGKGTRLAPYTSVLPKPLMPIGDRAILELVIDQLCRQGFTDITLSVGHLAHLIEAVFANGERHAARITYVREDTPHGTAGSLRLLGGMSDTFLLLNGDILTDLDIRDLLRDHRENGNLLTIATKVRQTHIDFGVINIEEEAKNAFRVVRYEEKPILDWVVSMGVYVLEPAALDFIPDGAYFDFPHLVQRLLEAGERVGAYLHEGFWLDIGRHEDFVQAVKLWEEGAFALIWPGNDGQTATDNALGSADEVEALVE